MKKYRYPPVLSGRYHDRLLWVRLFGRGVFLRDTNIYPLSFSERRGLHRLLRFGKWAIGYLPHRKPTVVAETAAE